MKIALLSMFSFLLGSVPFGVLFTRAKGIDLSSVGSGNIGATNVLRAAGKKAAILTLLGDLLKGTAAVAIGRHFNVGPFYEGLLGICAIAGHDFSVFRGFKGGKGVATSLGVMLIYAPLAGVLTVAIWLITAYLTKYSSLGAIVSFGLLPISAVLCGYPPIKMLMALPVSGILFMKHYGNIKRLISGTERRIGG